MTETGTAWWDLLRTLAMAAVLTTVGLQTLLDTLRRYRPHPASRRAISGAALVASRTTPRFAGARTSAASRPVGKGSAAAAAIKAVADDVARIARAGLSGEAGTE
jgi:hypothetical protein